MDETLIRRYKTGKYPHGRGQKCQVQFLGEQLFSGTCQQQVPSLYTTKGVSVMNRGKRIKKMRRYLLKQGYIRHERQHPGNKDYPPYRKGSYSISYIDERNDISESVGDANKYETYKALYQDTLRENAVRIHGRLNRKRFYAIPDGELKAILTPYGIAWTTDRSQLKEHIFTCILDASKAHLCAIRHRTDLEDYDIQFIVDELECGLPRHPFQELTRHTVNTWADDQPLVTGTLQNAVPKDLQNLQNLCWGW